MQLMEDKSINVMKWENGKTGIVFKTFSSWNSALHTFSTNFYEYVKIKDRSIIVRHFFSNNYYKLKEQ